MGTMGIVTGLSHVIEMSDQASLILLVGPRRRRRLLAVLPAPRSARNERPVPTRRTALQTAAGERPGTPVLISGTTVIIAMAGMFMTGNLEFTSMGRRHDHRRPPWP